MTVLVYTRITEYLKLRTLLTSTKMHTNMLFLSLKANAKISIFEAVFNIDALRSCRNIYSNKQAVVSVREGR